MSPRNRYSRIDPSHHRPEMRVLRKTDIRPVASSTPVVPRFDPADIITTRIFLFAIKFLPVKSDTRQVLGFDYISVA